MVEGVSAWNQNRDNLIREKRHGRRRKAKTGRFSSSHRAKENRWEGGENHRRRERQENRRRYRRAVERRRGPSRRRPLVGVTSPRERSWLIAERRVPMPD